MLEIIAAVYLGKNIKKIVNEKGRKATSYVIIMVLLWIGLEFAGAITGVVFFGEGAMVYVLALVGAAIGAGISYLIATSVKPVINTNEINEIGIESTENN